MSPVFHFDNPDEDFTSPFRTVTAGWYAAKITDIEERTYTHKATGEPRELWDVTYSCTEPGVEDPFLVKDPLFLTPKAWSRIKALLKACDLPHHGEVQLEAIDLLSLVMAVDLEFVIEEYEKNGERKSVEKMKLKGFAPWKPIGSLTALQAQDAAIDKKMKDAYQRREEERTGAPDLTKLTPKYDNPDPAAGPKKLPVQRDTMASIPEEDIPF